MNLDADFVNSQAPNAAAINNGRSLVVKGKFVALHRCEDDSLLFGECSGSGKSNYQCSCDFVRPTQPTYRCTCPSRQFPCKHCLGLMYALVEGKTFTVAEIPADLAEKRDKLAQRKKASASPKPKTVNVSALKKKISAQLKGLDLLEALVFDLVSKGMGAMNAKSARQVQEQAKQLGDAYLPGAQAALLAYTNLFIGDDGRFDGELPPQKRESIYTDALDQLTRLSTLVKHGRKVLNARLEDPKAPPQTDSPIAAWLGHAWQLQELRDAGLTQRDVELVQLAFHNYDDAARKEFVETGIWMNLNTGAIHLAQNYRPYRAAKHIREQDSFFKVAKVPELCVYPGKMNVRVRWDEFEQRDLTPDDLKVIRSHATDRFESLVKTIRTELKNPLADKRVIVAIAFNRMGTLPNGDLVIEDVAGERIVMTETGLKEEPPSCHLMPMLPAELTTGQVMIGRVHQDLDNKTLRVKPLSIVTEQQVFRLTL
ncbi:SWIM zinc finger family protein [Aporhodopirellula aestuarii]|uniref:SWIM zinc finger domain-containing protein n=1 Tax=Aporhodopirellula aestuarii TaxID=2950107 RepID=A0ABT0U8A9_9BACT|nr:SWIM zinc finger family protein [Aporhodopirellula aestuarii]MCM2373183.1 SWIM zinc finger domain-containing protein [Aporhodopirellula aestuarii]